MKNLSIAKYIIPKQNLEIGDYMLKIYFAATYSMRYQVAAWADQLRAIGIQVTSRWLSEDEKLDVQLSDLPNETHRLYGERDVEDVYACDVFVAVNDTERHHRQGRTAELGMVIMLNHLFPKHPRTILVVGDEHENVFHYQPNVFHFPDWIAVKAVLLEARNLSNGAR